MWLKRHLASFIAVSYAGFSGKHTVLASERESQKIFSPKNWNLIIFIHFIPPRHPCAKIDHPMATDALFNTSRSRQIPLSKDNRFDSHKNRPGLRQKTRPNISFNNHNKLFPFFRLFNCPHLFFNGSNFQNDLGKWGRVNAPNKCSL